MSFAMYFIRSLVFKVYCDGIRVLCYIRSSSLTTMKSPTAITALYGMSASFSGVLSRERLEV